MLYTAIIIEFRKHKAMSFVLNNFIENLSEEWKFIIFHGNINKAFIQEIVDNELQEHKQRIKMIHLPYDNILPHEYSRLLMDNTIIYDNIDTETFLIFQTDSIIIKKNKDLINQFLHYDYVGAPWDDYSLGNGGLSLRKKSKMLEIMEKEDTSRKNKENMTEDLFFALPEKVTIYKPTVEEACKFSVENVFRCLNPFGCHKPWYYGRDTFCKMHPEVEQLYNLQY